MARVCRRRRAACSPERLASALPLPIPGPDPWDPMNCSARRVSQPRTTAAKPLKKLPTPLTNHLVSPSIHTPWYSPTQCLLHNRQLLPGKQPSPIRKLSGFLHCVPKKTLPVPPQPGSAQPHRHWPRRDPQSKPCTCMCTQLMARGPRPPQSSHRAGLQRASSLCTHRAAHTGRPLQPMVAAPAREPPGTNYRVCFLIKGRTYWHTPCCAPTL